MIIPIYQHQGSSSHLLAQQIGQKYHTKATHTGTLDPMAEGVLIVLTDQDRFDKSKYSNWKKTYQFEILFGFATDSNDLLGMITDQQNIDLTPEELTKQLTKILPGFIGKQNQLMPTFSSKRINGESGFDIGKRGEKINKKQKIEIFKLQFNQLKQIKSSELIEQINNKINRVKGNFRQKKIIQNWHDYLANQDQIFYLIQLTATTSKRTYIRGLVRDISKKLDIAATTYSIVRTQNGPKTIKDCKKIE